MFTGDDHLTNEVLSRLNFQERAEHPLPGKNAIASGQVLEGVEHNAVK